ASDLGVLREVGGAAAEYCPIGNVEAWREKVSALLHERRIAPRAWTARRERGREHARRFTWTRYAADAAQVSRGVAAENGIIKAYVVRLGAHSAPASRGPQRAVCARWGGTERRGA